MEPRSRRSLLASTVAVALAGCSRAGDGDAAGPTRTDTDASAGTPTSTPTGTAGTEPGETEPTETPTETPVHADYETTEVRVRTPDGERLGAVTAAVADTPELRYRGLSDTDHLPEDRGMLFVYDDVADRTFVMRGMDFGIDIVYADDGGTITRIHHAPEPGPDEDGSEQRYPGRGQYVLEVNYGWTTERGVEEGDVLGFER